MSCSDYNDLILQNSQSTDTLCLSCKQSASIKYIKITDVHPEIVLVVFECKTCNIKNTSIFNEKSNTKRLVITCFFKNKDDLKREVNLNMNTQLFLEYKSVKYEHESSLPIVISVEGIIDQALDALQNNTVFGDRGEMMKIMEILKGIKDEPKFYMRIEDKDGSSRVGLRDRGIYEMQNCPIEEFNDSFVTHEYLQ
ncbi:zinc finger protein ZPR1 [Vairimorpha necatrix]|uniref:Zinc finger protein ZPR1 n=1 Tax=Vairimorpha necatrix TaxID=6039 RepID=A0AAX4JGA9_9MICR